MQIVNTPETNMPLSVFLPQVQKDSVCVQSAGIDVAYILSPAHYQRITQENLTSFITFCDEVGSKAAAKGMDEATLQQLLAE